MAPDDTTNELPSQSSGLGGWRWFWVYALLSLFIQWPLVGSLTTHISYGHEREITVPLLNLWTVWWNADRASHGFRGYWNAPIFHPTEKTFVFSEAQPTSVIVAPIIGLTGNRGLAYNVYQLLILTLNGFSAHRLLRRLGHIPWLAFCGGVMSQILPFVMWQFGVVQLTTLFGIHWTLHAVLDLFGAAESQIPRREVNDGLNESNETVSSSAGRTGFRFPVGIRLGIAYGLTYWLCNYWGLFLTILLLPSSVCFWNRRLVERSFWRQLVWVGLIALVTIGPFAWLQYSRSREHNWQNSRSANLVYDLSAHSRDHTDVPWNTISRWLEFPDKNRENWWSLGGGGLKLLLVPLGLLIALMTKQRRRWGIFAVLFGVIAFGISLGPTVRFVDGFPLLGGMCPYTRLQQFVPGFSLIRSPFRFALFVQLAAVWLSVEALDALNPARWLSRRLRDSEFRHWRLPSALNPLFGMERDECLFFPTLIPLVLASGLVTLEAVPPKTQLFELPSRNGLPTWVVWLRDNAEPNRAIACLPFPTGNDVESYEETTLWMYWSTFHRRPLVNGYSGFFPDSYVKTKEALEQFIHPDDLNPDDVYKPQFKDYAWDNLGLKRLNESSVRYIVMKRSFGTQYDVWKHPATRLRWALVASDEFSKIDIYQVPEFDE